MNDETVASDQLADLIPANAAYQRPRISFLYALLMLLVGAMMLLLPAIYVALLALAGWAVYYHATHNFHRIMAWGGVVLNWRVEFLKVLIFAAPLFGGLVLVFFMIKPLFAPRHKRPQPYSLNPEMEPRLFAFIASVCELVGAPRPTRIDLNCDLNASAGFRRGFRSMMSNDLVLTLGLPLIATCSVEEFAAVLAHEFGHFSQGFGMRAGYVIRSINFWFARVVYHRDAWDEMLDEWERDSDHAAILLIVLTARLGVWVSRLILTGLMLAGHALSSALSRQKEFNADAYAIRAVGSAVHEKMIRRLVALAYIRRSCDQDMRAMWKADHMLPDNFPLFLANKVEETSSQILTQIDDRLGLERTGWLDDHPCNADRIRQARRLAAEGFFRCDRPTTELFEHFPAPAKFVTLFNYQEMGILITPEYLRPINPSKTEREQATIEADARLARYFCGVHELMRPLDISTQQIVPPKDASVERTSLKEFRLRIAPVAAQVEEIAQAFSAARDREFKAMIDTTVATQTEDPSAAARQAEQLEAQTEREQAERSLRAVVDEVRAQLIGTLGFLYNVPFSATLADSEDLKLESRLLASFLHPFAAAFPKLEECRRDLALLQALHQLPVEQAEPLWLPATQRLAQDLYHFREATITLPRPFPVRGSSKNMFDEFAGYQLESDDPQVVGAVAAKAIDGFSALYARAVNRLAHIAEIIETAL